MGRIYQQPGSTKFYLDYLDVEGRRQRVSARTDDRDAAIRKLRDVEGRVARQEPVLPHVEGVKYDHLAAELRAHYETTGARGLEEAGYRLAHLDPFFRGVRAVAIDRPMITRYVQHRQHQGASNGTVNRELGVLGRMLNLALENGRLLRTPSLRGLKPTEATPRQGFFERGQFEAVCRRLAADLQAAVAIAYAFGWRTQSEVLTLERRHLDLKAKTLRLDPGMTKNGEGRTVALPDDLALLLERQLGRVDAAQRKAGRVIPYLFPYLSGKRRLGARRRDFRKAWAAACKASGVPGRLRHDLRRTAARDMEREGVPRTVAMQIIGHKTEAMYRRYAIVNEADHREAARKRNGIVSGIVAPQPLETCRASM
jgi:integrase